MCTLATGSRLLAITCLQARPSKMQARCCPSKGSTNGAACFTSVNGKRMHGGVRYKQLYHDVQSRARSTNIHITYVRRLAMGTTVQSPAPYIEYLQYARHTALDCHNHAAHQGQVSVLRHARVRDCDCDCDCDCTGMQPMVMASISPLRVMVSPTGSAQNVAPSMVPASTDSSCTVTLELLGTSIEGWHSCLTSFVVSPSWCRLGCRQCFFRTDVSALPVDNCTQRGDFRHSSCNAARYPFAIPWPLPVYCHRYSRWCDRALVPPATAGHCPGGPL